MNITETRRAWLGKIASGGFVRENCECRKAETKVPENVYFWMAENGLITGTHPVELTDKGREALKPDIGNLHKIERGQVWETTGGVKRWVVCVVSERRHRNNNVEHDHKVYWTRSKKSFDDETKNGTGVWIEGFREWIDVHGAQLVGQEIPF